MHAIPEGTRRAASAMAAHELVRDVAVTLKRSGVDVMPIKGALFQKILYADPAERALTDVDVVVRPTQLDLSVRALTSHGYERAGDNDLFAVTFRTPFALTLDLHGGLFDRARYRYPVDAMFARARGDSELFGAPVLIPSPADVYAQLVGKCVSDHLDDRAADRLREIALAGERLPVKVSQVAEHLAFVGMARAARYALPLVTRVTGDRFAAAIVQALPSDPVGRALATLSAKVINATPNDGRPGAVAAHLLNASVARGLWSGWRSMRRRSSA